MEIPHTNKNAEFFIADVLSFVFRECRVEWMCPRKDLISETRALLTYTFTPEMGKAVMWILVLLRNQLLSDRFLHDKWIDVTNVRFRKSVIFYGILHDPFLRAFNIDSASAANSWSSRFYILLAIVADMCIYYYRIGQIAVATDIIWAAERTIHGIMMEEAGLKIRMLIGFAQHFQGFVRET